MQVAPEPRAAAEANAALRAAALSREATLLREGWLQRRASRRRDADDAAAGETQAAERAAAFAQAVAARHARRLERRALRRRGAEEAAAAERAADEADAARLGELLEVAAAVRAADEAEAELRVAALAQAAAEAHERRLQRRERLQRRVAQRREALEATAADEAGAAMRAAAAARAAADKRDRRLERRAGRRREREDAIAAERVADEADAARRRAAEEAAAAALRALEEANAALRAASERSRLLREEHAERARRQEADAAAGRRAAAAAEAAAPAAAAVEGAMPADIAELLRGLELSQHGAALQDRLGVRSVADLSNVTAELLRDALPELQSAERVALLVAVEVALWAAGVAPTQPPETPPAAEAQPAADDEPWEADWTMLDRPADVAPVTAAAPDDEALRPQTPASLQPASSADPCVKCRRFRRLAVNTPCGHAFMCRGCTADFRGANGEICNQCRQPSTVSDAAHSLTCCICQDDVTRTAEMFYFEPCGHMTCLKCAVELVRSALGDADEKFPFRCEPCRIDALQRRAQPPAPVPVDDLLRRLPMLRADIEAVGVAQLSDDEMARFRRFNAVSLVPVNRRAYCPAAACGAMMVVEPDAVTRSRAAGGALKRCAACPTTFCLGCSATPFHEGASCEAHAAHLARHAGTDTATAAFIQQTTRPCPGCGLRVTHYRGHACHHISPGRGCPQCATHWCFRCGAAAPTPPHRCEAPSCVGHLFCDDTCTCPDCPVCKPGQPCTGAAGCDNDGRCRSCRPL